MKTFYDYYRNQVKLSFEDHPFSTAPKHVWVICRFKNQWLLTKHKDRGLEFPGGKVEKGEGAKDAAVREVKEETGAEVENLYYIGQYYVAGKGGTIVKNVYYATISELIEQPHYYETEGPILLDHLPESIKSNALYSFMMKDEVLTECLKVIKNKYKDSH
ncbi:putative 8-oxo-dGTP diphosphatase YtkD [Halobacillus andaensis]|uniref:8-oxo-dGTP diphosphatase YtkD n=1 Tax=Halobacillus andaensis TaxID=1176239 RepID=A0A917EY28_HALAA|nr:nucleoside triphosphatase YtkD [Halobacillus andaensis]MBP2005625.1 8-oxo-dGTP diphosphatase [Halobacillus andaensis]GGF32981.1 putative 8-oxo-dGTP diphosphatase YtkD [Halobacillus andaensis]